MPVESATDLLLGKLLVLNEHYCDFGRLFPHARALREQIDWATVRARTENSPFARAFFVLLEGLEILPSPPTHRPQTRVRVVTPTIPPSTQGG